jgi:hypothetical protein
LRSISLRSFLATGPLNSTAKAVGLFKKATGGGFVFWVQHSAECVMGALAIFIAPLLAGHKDCAPGLTPGSSMLEKVLDCFSLTNELGDSCALEQTLVRFFDPDYYGRFSMDKALATSLSQNRNYPQESPTDGAKKLSVYMTAEEDPVPYPCCAGGS